LIIDRILQFRFPIDEILLRSGNIRDQVVKLPEIAPRFWRFGAANFVGKVLQVSGVQLQIGLGYMYVSPSNTLQS